MRGKRHACMTAAMCPMESRLGSIRLFPTFQCSPFSTANRFFHVPPSRHSLTCFSFHAPYISVLISCDPIRLLILICTATTPPFPPQRDSRDSIDMVFQGRIQSSTEGRYQRLRDEAERAVRPRRRWLWKVKGKVRSFRVSPSKRLKWMRFIVVPRRIAELYAGIVKTMRKDEVYPTIIFSCQWGLPVLSHPTVDCRKRAVSLHTQTLSFS